MQCTPQNRAYKLRLVEAGLFKTDRLYLPSDFFQNAHHIIINGGNFIQSQNVSTESASNQGHVSFKDTF